MAAANTSITAAIYQASDDEINAYKAWLGK
jgi:hypothetical protein